MGVANKLYRRVLIVGLAAAAAGSMPAAAQQPKKTLRVVMHSDLKILDPMWTTAYIVRNHGYMIYDTLFSVDAKLEPKPQMVDTWSVSDDRLTYTFALRDGLNFHDGAPVTSDDVIASLKRWGVNDTVGKRLMRALKEFKAVDAKTFQIVLTEPFNYMIKALAKPSSTVPFILPKRVAETPASQQIRETIGSGPFVFKQDEWRVGEKVVYEKKSSLQAAQRTGRRLGWRQGR